jgi:transcriptional regulator
MMTVRYWKSISKPENTFMGKHSTDLLRGTLDLLILKTLALEPRHGVAIADRIAQITGGTFVIKPGSLFPALHRLEAEGFIVGQWGATPEGRRAKVYTLSAAGRKQLQTEKKNWLKISLAMGQVLEAD